MPGLSAESQFDIMTSSLSGRPTASTIAGIALFLVAGLLFTSLDTIAKYLSRDYSIFQIAWARYTFAMVAMAALVPRPTGADLWRPPGRPFRFCAARCSRVSR